MDVVQVISPEGDGVVVSEVVFGEPPESWVDVGGQPARGDAYESLDEAMRRNNRSITTANIVEADDAASAKAMLGKPPAEIG